MNRSKRLLSHTVAAGALLALTASMSMAETGRDTGTTSSRSSASGIGSPSTGGTYGRNDNWQSDDQTNRAGQSTTRSRDTYMEQDRLARDSSQSPGTSRSQGQAGGDMRHSANRSSGSSYTEGSSGNPPRDLDSAADSRISRNLGGQNSRTSSGSVFRDTNNESFRDDIRARRNPGGDMSDTTVHSSGNISQQGSRAGSTSGPGAGTTGAGSATGSSSTR